MTERETKTFFKTSRPPIYRKLTPLIRNYPQNLSILSKKYLHKNHSIARMSFKIVTLHSFLQFEERNSLGKIFQKSEI